MKLSEDLIKDIYAYGAAGREAWRKGEIADAEASFIRAWEVLPEPREQYDLAQSLARGFVVFYRDTKQFDKAIHWLAEVKKAYGSGTGPDLTIRFLSGTVYFEAGDLDKSAEFLVPLYEKFGSRPFSGEDKKYLEFAKRASKGSK